jgi:hypothetical protein
MAWCVTDYAQKQLYLYHVLYKSLFTLIRNREPISPSHYAKYKFLYKLQKYGAPMSMGCLNATKIPPVSGIRQRISLSSAAATCIRKMLVETCTKKYCVSENIDPEILTH